MNHTECEDCKLRSGDCGHHFKMNGKGKTNYDIPSLTACDKYGDCMFFQREEKPQGDLISRKALKETLNNLYNETADGIVKFGIEKAYKEIDNAPPVDISKEVWNKSNELLHKRLSYLGRPRGQWIVTAEDNEGVHRIQCPFCRYEKGSDFIDYITVTFEKFPPFCESCGADMRGKEE